MKCLRVDYAQEERDMDMIKQERASWRDSFLAYLTGQVWRDGTKTYLTEIVRLFKFALSEFASREAVHFSGEGVRYEFDFPDGKRYCVLVCEVRSEPSRTEIAAPPGDRD